jgi:S1-C subfamily serine protease
MAHRKYVKHIKRIRHSATVLCLLAVTFMFAPQSVAQEKPKAKHASISTILRAVVGIRSKIPKDAISAQTLGTEREGSGVVIDSTGLILTVGYLVLEASEIVVTRPGGRKISAKLIGYDSVSGLS